MNLNIVLSKKFMNLVNKSAEQFANLLSILTVLNLCILIQV